MRKYIHWAKLLFGWPLSFLALALVVRFALAKKEVIQVSLHHPLLLIIGLLLYSAFYFLRALFWQQILSQKGHTFSFAETAYLWGMAELKRYIPGNIWAFLARSVSFTDRGVPGKVLLSGILLETGFLVTSSFTVSLLAVTFLLGFVLHIPSYPWFLITALQTITVCGVLVYLGGVSFFRFNKPPFTHFLPSFGFFTNLRLFCLSFLYMFLYGLGTFFVIISVFPLPLQHILEFSGFFAFALIIGYLSLITPMGLGVREGLVVLGLTPFLPVSAAAVASIFSRILLMVSELLFLVISTFLHFGKSKQVILIQDTVKKYRYEVLLSFLILLYIGYFFLASTLRYDNFFTGRFDLGNMDQTVWNTMRGRVFQMTDPNGTDIISRLAFHADFLLVLAAPFYWIWPNPKVLLLIQTVVLAFGAFFVYKISLFVKTNKPLSLVFAASFLLNPSVQYANLYDFHAVTLATTFLLGMFYFMIKRKYLMFLLFAVLAGISKEHIWIIISLAGFYIAFVQKKRFIGLSVLFLSVFVFYFLVWIAIPNARGTSHFALSYYSDFGTTPTSIIKNILFSPAKTIATITSQSRISYLNHLILPVGYLPLLSPLFLVFAVPDLLINLLSNNSQLHEIYFQYTSAITPFLFIGAIYTASRLQTFWLFRNALVYYVLFFALYGAFTLGPMPGAKNPGIDMFTKQLSSKKEVDNFLSRIPKRYSVAATNNLGSHLSRRQRIFTVPVGIDKADVVVFLLNDPFAQPSLKAQTQMVISMKKDKNYTLLFEKGDFIAFRKTDIPNFRFRY